MSISSLSPIDVAACRETLRGGSRSFFAASFFLPRKVRDPASVLYAFCRLADDAVDLGDSRPEILESLRERLGRIYEGYPSDHAADRALASVVEAFAIPKSFLDALLEGLEWDALGRRYDDIGDLRAYAVRVAGSVGAMMSLLMGERRPKVVSLACDLGVAMQLTNIARDVGEDARADRLYLPRQWLREAGIDPDAWLAAPEFDDALASVIQRVLQSADELYERADIGIRQLPLSCRPGINAARHLYAEIGYELERRGLDSVSQRAVVPASRKMALLAKSVGKSVSLAVNVPTGMLDEGRILIDALAAAPAAPELLVQPGRMPSWRRVDDQIAWVIDLFERLERQDQRERFATSTSDRRFSEA